MSASAARRSTRSGSRKFAFSQSIAWSMRCLRLPAMANCSRWAPPSPRNTRKKISRRINGAITAIKSGSSSRPMSRSTASSSAAVVWPSATPGRLGSGTCGSCGLASRVSCASNSRSNFSTTLR
jgi:hypothetical protein